MQSQGMTLAQSRINILLIFYLLGGSDLLSGDANSHLILTCKCHRKRPLVWDAAWLCTRPLCSESMLSRQIEISNPAVSSDASVVCRNSYGLRSAIDVDLCAIDCHLVFIQNVDDTGGGRSTVCQLQSQQ